MAEVRDEAAEGIMQKLDLSDVRLDEVVTLAEQLKLVGMKNVLEQADVAKAMRMIIGAALATGRGDGLLSILGERGWLGDDEDLPDEE